MISQLNTLRQLRNLRAALTAGVLTALIVFLVPPTFADYEDIQVEMKLAAPATYNHELGGGAYNDGTDAADGDILSKAQGSDFACGDIISYLVLITVDDAAEIDDHELELEFEFDVLPTGQPGLGHTDVVGAYINYGQVENGDDGSGNNPGPGRFGLDSAIVDDRQTVANGDSGAGGSQVQYTATFAPAGTTPFNGAETLQVSVRVDDLDRAESVVLRLDVAISCQPASSPSGNLQGRYAGGTVLGPNGLSEPLDSSAQTLKLNKLSDIAGINAPLLVLRHTVMEAGGICGEDDGETILVHPGDEVTFCVTVENLGTETLYDVAVAQRSAQGNSVLLQGLVDLDGQGDEGDLPASGTAMGSYSVVYQATGIDQRTVTGTGSNGNNGNGLAPLVDEDSASVTISAPTAVTLGELHSDKIDRLQSTLIMLISLSALALYLICQLLRTKDGLLLPSD